MDRTILQLQVEMWGATEAAGIELEAVKLASTVLQGNFELPKVVDTGDRG